MGFWDFMNRMVNGKPVFDQQDFRDEDGNPLPTQQESAPPTRLNYSARSPQQLPIDSHGREILPVFDIIQSGIHESGENYLDMWVTIKNTSDRTLDLETTDFLGQRIRCCHRFTPGQQRQIEVYKGTVPVDDNYKNATLYYKEIHDGQYFYSLYLTQYRIEHASRYLPSAFRLLQAFKNT